MTTQQQKIICVDCNRDFTNECDGRSSFDEIGKIQCENCFLKEDEYGAKILCNDCDYYISSEDFDAGNGRTMIDALDNGEYRCEVCNEKYGAKILCNDGDYYISSKDFASWSW